jgi:hypothetical protein
LFNLYCGLPAAALLGPCQNVIIPQRIGDL